MVKDVYISQLAENGAGSNVMVTGWLLAARNHGSVMFLDVVDSSGLVQCVVRREEDTEQIFERARSTPVESAVRVKGKIAHNRSALEIAVADFEIVGEFSHDLSPRPRAHFDIFDPRFTDHTLSNRHLYIRHPQVGAALRARDKVVHYLHQWFHGRDYIEIAAPILTALPLYSDETALRIDVQGQRVFLTQCVGFYLEAAVHAFERVYNIGPSFRGEESRSKRHLLEYWHVKAEAVYVSRSDLFLLVEGLISDVNAFVLEHCAPCAESLGVEITTKGLFPPFPQLAYQEAVKILQERGYSIQFGDGLSSSTEAALASGFASPFWVVGIPRTLEPFPYCIDPDDDQLTLTADLIAPDGYGELLGIAEKIYNLNELLTRMAEKGKLDDARYGWLIDLRRSGCVPHGGLGMGLERLLRWLFQVDHVRDWAAFPRLFGRRILP